MHVVLQLHVMHVIVDFNKGHLAFGAHIDRLHCVRIDDHVCVSQVTCGLMRNMQRIETLIEKHQMISL